ncbi:MAG: DUF4136 domain-containing protein [Verrucomicrobiota bacterium]
MMNSIPVWPPIRRHATAFLALLLGSGLLLGLVGCSTPGRVNTGTIHAHTFSFVPNSAGTTPPYADKREAIHRMIQDAITRDLGEHGLVRVDSGGDLVVGYLVIVGNNALTTAVDDYFNHTDDRIALQDRAHAAYTGGDVPYYYEAGTLVIDIRDAKTDKLLKRGYATQNLLRDIPEDARYGRIQSVVERILRDLKVSP